MITLPSAINFAVHAAPYAVLGMLAIAGVVFLIAIAIAIYQDHNK